MALSLLSSLLLIVIATELIACIGKTRVADIFFALYARIARPTGYQKQRQLKVVILQTKADLSKTSSQDEFAKWARLRRKLDKDIAELERLNGELSTQRTAFLAAAITSLFVVTTVLPFIFTSWHRTSAVFYVPFGWFGIMESVLCLPFAPTGAVSCAVFGVLSRRALKLCGRAGAQLLPGLIVSSHLTESASSNRSVPELSKKEL